MQAAKMKYEESEYDIIQKMATLQEYEVSVVEKSLQKHTTNRS
jgi:ABC-type sulfate transport system substrate-binding protein